MINLFQSCSLQIWSGHQMVFFVERVGMGWDLPRWDWPGTVFFFNPVTFIWMERDKSKTQSCSYLYDTVSYCYALCRLTQCFGVDKEIPVSSSAEEPETGRARWSRVLQRWRSARRRRVSGDGGGRGRRRTSRRSSRTTSTAGSTTGDTDWGQRRKRFLTSSVTTTQSKLECLSVAFFSVLSIIRLRVS